MSLSFVLIYGCVTTYIPFVNICWVDLFSIYPAVKLWLPPLLEWYLVPASTRRFQIWSSSSLPIPRWADKRSWDLVSEKMSKKVLNFGNEEGGGSDSHVPDVTNCTWTLFQSRSHNYLHIRAIYTRKNKEDANFPYKRHISSKIRRGLAKTRLIR